MGQTSFASDTAPDAQRLGADDIAVADECEMAAVEHESRSATVGANQHGRRIDQFVADLAPEFSRNYLQGLIEAGYATVNARPVAVCSKKVTAGQVVRIELVPTPESRAFRPEPIALRIVFEDEHLLVVDKPAGLVVHPAAGHWSGTLLNGLLAHHAGAASLARAGIVHRLDKDTSGLMVVGKSLVAVTALTRAIAAHEVHRQYLAICHGVLGRRAYHVDAPVGRDPVSRIKMAVVASGRAAQTDVYRLAVTTDTAPVLASGVRCVLHTGRTHQIRVHMASLGHPLLADELYGGRCCAGLNRQALHAVQLAFAHPVSGQAMRFQAEPPEDWAVAWRQVFGDVAIPAAEVDGTHP